MPDLVVSITVTPPTLQLQNPGTYRVVEFGPGDTAQRRQVATSSFTDGEALVNSLKQAVKAHLKVRVYGTSESDVGTKLAALTAAFDQFAYVLAYSLNTSGGSAMTGSWNCEPADWSVGKAGMLDNYELMSFVQDVSFSVPRSPLPGSGPL